MLAALIAFAIAAAPPAPGALAGIWEGTVGTLPVRACFAPREWGPLGSYYYLSSRRVIALTAPGGTSGTYFENDERDANAPRWTIETARGDELTARWTNRGRTLPVRLRRIAPGTAEQEHCIDMAYHRQRLEGVRTITSPASLDGVAYTQLTLDHRGRFDAGVETFALAGSGAAADRLNAALRQSLSGDPPEWFDCIRSALAQSPNEGSFNQRLAPTLISTRWLVVVEQHDTFCGGAYPDYGQRYRTFDLTSGQEIDLHDWLNDAAVMRERLQGSDEDIKILRPELRSLILAGWRPGDSECADGVRDHDAWEIGLTREAFVFSPDLHHVAQACGEEFTIPFARLGRFLTPQGAANIRALAAERPRSNRRGG